MSQQWIQALPKPIAFVLSGGCTLGAMQVGMLRALRDAGIQPDLVVGASVGALNGAVVANYGLDKAVDILENAWARLRRHDIFPGSFSAQFVCLLRTRRSLFPSDELRRLIRTHVTVLRFVDLTTPLGVLATEMPGYRATLLRSGDLLTALLASTAIPGLFPSVKIEGKRYIDGGFSDNVPLQAAMEMGAASILVLHTGNAPYPNRLPRNLTETFSYVLQGALRQRLPVDAPAIAQKLPIVYLPTPPLQRRNLLNFDHCVDLMHQAADLTAHFLATAPPPTTGVMCSERQLPEVFLSAGQRVLAST